MPILETAFAGKILKSSEITFKHYEKIKIKMAMSVANGGNAVTGGVLDIEYGFSRVAGNAGQGQLDFPPLSFGVAPVFYTNGTKNLVLLFQDEDMKDWGHGIWILANNISFLEKKDGTPPAGVNPADKLAAFQGGDLGTHASLTGVTGVTVVEPYYAPTPPAAHNYSFYFMATDLEVAALKTKLSPVVKKGNGKSTFADRYTQIKTILGDNLLEEAKVSFDYPKKKP